MAESDTRRIEYIALAELVTRLHPKNAKGHDIGQLIESFKVHQYVATGIIDSRTGLLLAGHGRVEALAMMKKQNMLPPGGVRNGGDDWLVPVQVGYESENDIAALAYLAVDNKLTELGGWNEPELAELLQEVHNSGEIALEATGFDADGLDELLRDLGMMEEPPEDPGAQIDRAAELQEKWQVQCGDVWAIGGHRVMCDSATNDGAVSELLGDLIPDMILTDPPYGVNMDKGFDGAGGFSGRGKPIPRRQYSDDWDSSRPESFDVLLSMAKRIIIFGGNFFTDLLPVSGHWLVWDKKNTMPTFGDCELAWTNIDRKSVKLYEFEYNGLIGKEDERFHPTQKPSGLFTQIIDDYTEPGAVVVDFFLGSGTTIVACEQTGRVGYGMEIAPEYVAVTLQRLSDMGLTPERIDNG